MENGIEVVFWGTDAGEIELKDAIRDVKLQQNFARSMSLADAMNPNNILCYEMNGAASAGAERFPAAADRTRLVRHRQRQVAEAHRSARQTLHEPVHGARLRHHPRGRPQRRDGVGRNLGRPRPAEVGASEGHPERHGYRITGAAWGAPIDRVEVKIDDGPWMPATIDHSEEAEFAWKIWSSRLAKAGTRRAHGHLARDRRFRANPTGDGRSLDRQEAHLLGKQRPGDAPH